MNYSCIYFTVNEKELPTSSRFLGAARNGVGGTFWKGLNCHLVSVWSDSTGCWPGLPSLLSPSSWGAAESPLASAGLVSVCLRFLITGQSQAAFSAVSMPLMDHTQTLANSAPLFFIANNTCSRSFWGESEWTWK